MSRKPAKHSERKKMEDAKQLEQILFLLKSSYTCTNTSKLLEISNINNDSGINNSHHLIKSYIKNENINYNLNFKDLISNEYQLDKDSYERLALFFVKLPFL